MITTLYQDLRVRALILLVASIPGFSRADTPTYFRLNEPQADFRLTSTAPTETPDGKHLVYSKQQRLSQPPFVVRHLYSTDRRGTAERRLTTTPTGSGTGSFLFRLSANSRYVVYTSFQTCSVCTELFSTDLETGQVVRLNADLVAGGAVSSNFTLSADGNWVIYIADQTVDGVNEAFLVPTSGGPVRRLHDPLATGQSVRGANITPDGRRVVLLANFGAGDHLYSVDLATHSLTDLSGSTSPTGDPTISPDSSHVVFTALSSVPFTVDLYSVPSEGGTPVRISPELTETSGLGNLNYGTRAISPDSQWVVYRSDHDVTGKFEFFAVGIDGGTPIRISEPRTQSSRRNSIFIRTILPDNTVIFTNDSEVPDTRFHVFAASILDGTVRRLSHAYQGFKFAYAAISPDGRYVLYRASESTASNASSELYLAPVAGGPVRKINLDLQPGRDVYAAAVSSDNQWIVYHADQLSNDVIELFRVPVAGGTPEKINPHVTSSVGGGRGISWYISADSRSVYYNAEIDTLGVMDLYASTLPIEVPLDIKPGTCPNPLNLSSKGVLASAIAGNGRINLDDLDETSLTLNGVPVMKASSDDVATPSTPFYGKTSATQCTTAGSDGVNDLIMHVSVPPLAATLSTPATGDTQLIELRGTLKSGGTIIGEDFVTLKVK